MHDTLKHTLRGKGRDSESWGAACDLVIGQIISEDGFALRQEALSDKAKEFVNWTAERIYDKLMDGGDRT